MSSESAVLRCKYARYSLGRNTALLITFCSFRLAIQLAIQFTLAKLGRRRCMSTQKKKRLKNRYWASLGVTFDKQRQTGNSLYSGEEKFTDFVTTAIIPLNSGFRQTQIMLSFLPITTGKFYENHYCQRWRYTWDISAALCRISSSDTRNRTRGNTWSRWSLSFVYYSMDRSALPKNKIPDYRNVKIEEEAQCISPSVRETKLLTAQDKLEGNERLLTL